MKKEKTWTTKDGETVKIKDMETSHIQNCIYFLEEKAREGVDVVYSFGWGENEYKEGDIGVRFGDNYLRITEYDYLKEELRERK